MGRMNFFVVLLVFFFSCSADGQHHLSENEKSSYMKLGDRISMEMQNELLSNVAKAIREGGTEYAVEFCHQHALPITDSMANLNKVFIERLSDKNRNPENVIQTDVDIEAWERVRKEKVDFIVQGEKGEVIYYKPILLAMKTCMQCHGKVEEIKEGTLQVIHDRYPEDKATGYELGDLRGMWKLTFADR